MQNFWLWLRRRGKHGDDETTGPQAVIARAGIRTEETARTGRAEALAERATRSTRRNHFAEALAITYQRKA